MRVFCEKSDAELVALLREGSYDAFHEIHHRYAGVMYKNALAMLGDHCLAEDVTQDVFFTIWKKRSELAVKSTLSGYIYGITRFTTLAHLKRGQHFQRYLETLKVALETYAESPDERLLKQEETQRVETAIHSLPHRMREILLMRQTGTHTYREIADILGISEGRVKNSISEAVKVLRTKLQIFFFIFF